MLTSRPRRALLAPPAVAQERRSTRSRRRSSTCVGLQAQAPLAVASALWSRLAGFDAEALAGAVVDHHAVRIPLLHLVTADGRALQLRRSSSRSCEQVSRGGLSPATSPTRSGRGTRGRRGLLAAEPRARARGASPQRLALRAPPNALVYANMCGSVHVPPRSGCAGPRPARRTWTTNPNVAGRPLDEVDAPANRAPLPGGGVRPRDGFQIRQVTPSLGCSRCSSRSARAGHVPRRRWARVVRPADAPRPDPVPAPRALPARVQRVDRPRRSDADHPGRPADPPPPGSGTAGALFLLDGMYARTWRIHGTAR